MKWLFVLLFMSVSLQATTIKLATLVPEGTTWGNSLKKIADEVKRATNNEVELKIYFGGVAGDEPDVLRKMRIGQIHGGIFTGKTLGEIHGDVRSIEIPFTFFNDEKKAISVLKKLEPVYEQKLASKKFMSLGFYHLGQVYVVTTKKMSNLQDLKGLKMWSWEGDPLVGAMLESLSLVSVPLSLPDVLSSLSTGIIESAYAPPLGMLALQWQSKIKFLINFPCAFSIGALLVSDQVYKKLSPQAQKTLKDFSRRLIDEANMKTQNETLVALNQLKKMGVTFVEFPQKDYEEATRARQKVMAAIRGKYVSEQMIEQLEKALK